MIYLFKHIVVRTKREVNEVYKSLLGEDYFDTSDESYNGEEVITSRDECIQIHENSFEISKNDGSEGCTEFDMHIARYRVEHRHKIDGCICDEIIDESDAVLDPEKYLDCCSEGDEIRIYNNHTNKLLDAYRREKSDEEEFEEIADRIEQSLKKDNSLDREEKYADSQKR